MENNALAQFNVTILSGVKWRITEYLLHISRQGIKSNI